MKKTLLFIFGFLFAQVVGAQKIITEPNRLLRKQLPGECFPLLLTKKYLSKKTSSYGSSIVEFTCEYQCLDHQGTIHEVVGTKAVSFKGYAQEGRVMVCEGANMIHHKPWGTYIWEVDGVRPFAAQNSKIQELLDWAQDQGFDGQAPIEIEKKQVILKAALDQAHQYLRVYKHMLEHQPEMAEDFKLASDDLLKISVGGEQSEELIAFYLERRDQRKGDLVQYQKLVLEVLRGVFGKVDKMK